MAISEAHLAAEFNRPGFAVINHYIYGIVTDGDLMEGVASEAASLAGHLGLGKIIYLYDDNRITIDGSTDLAFTEDRAARFEAYGWHVLKVLDGNDLDAVDSAITQAKKDPRPSIVICRTHIGYGLPTRQDTAKAHGEPPGQEELDSAKINLGWPVEPKFYVPDDVLALFRKAIKRGEKAELLWRKQLRAYLAEYTQLDTELERRLMADLPENWDSDLPIFPADLKGIATRAASGNVINVLASRLPELMGGSADLAPSNNTWIKDIPDFQKHTPEGRNFHFGVREYGPTHQPVEHLAALRAIPNLVVIRPADANEVTEAWKVAISRRSGPTTLILTRQAIPVLDRSIYAPADGLHRGAYVLADMGASEPDLILLLCGWW